MGEAPSEGPRRQQALTTRRPSVDLRSLRRINVVGASGSGKTSFARRLAEILGAPIVNTVNAKGVVPSSHPLAVGGSGSCAAVRDAFREADVVLGAGTELHNSSIASRNLVYLL